ncbi:MAG TPA: cytochrome c [Thermoanaerobaculia bacterium]
MKRVLLFVAILTCACRRDMFDRPARRPLGASAFFADRSASRPQVAGTVARPIAEPPVTADVRRGRERYEIYCAPCHGHDGNGNGVIVRHGFPRPPAFRPDESIEEIVNAITNGAGTMYSYRDSLSPRDRLAIAAYIREVRR